MLHLDATRATPLYQQLYEQVKQDIITGVIPEGKRLLSIRALAKELQLARNTVQNAYAQLALEGYVTALPGSGFTVNRVQYDLNPVKNEPAPVIPGPANNTGSRAVYTYDFHFGNLDAATFPYRIWRKLACAALDESGALMTSHDSMLAYSDPKGYIGLRKELASYLYRSRGVCCTPDQVLVCSGLQPALTTLLHLFPYARKRAAMEEPAYTGARSVYRRSGFEITPVDVGTDGIDVKALSGSNVRMAHVTPSHQFPTGAVMPIRKRMELLHWAAENKNLIIEDDYDSELRYNGRPIPSLQSIDRHGSVVYLGSFSKALSPGMRMGYMVLPEWLVQRFNTVFAGCQCTVPWIEQNILTRFMAEGYWDRHLRSICAYNKKKHDTLVNTATRLFSDKVTIHGRNAGLHVLLEFPEGRNEQDLTTLAAQAGVRVCPVSPFWLNPERYKGNCIVLAYGLMTEKAIPPALELLYEAWFGTP